MFSALPQELQERVNVLNKQDWKKLEEEKNKLKQLKGCLVSNSNSNELFKWWRLIMFKIKIRSIRSKLLYFFICLYSNENSFLRFSEYSKIYYIVNERVQSKKVLLK